MADDTTVKKVSSAQSPLGSRGEVHLASGKRVSMRLWRNEEPSQDKPMHSHDYEVVGYVISGRAELQIEGQSIRLEPGDSWFVPAHAWHTYRILETFTAVEATAPPAQVHGREKGRSGVSELTQNAMAGAQRRYPEATRYVQEGTRYIREPVRENPLIAIVAAGAIGYALASLIQSRSHRERGSDVPDYARTRTHYRWDRG